MSSEANKPIEEGAIEVFEEQLAGPNGAALFKRCSEQLDAAEKEIRTKLARGANRIEGNELKQLHKALSEGKKLLDAVWSDIRR